VIIEFWNLFGAWRLGFGTCNGCCFIF